MLLCPMNTPLEDVYWLFAAERMKLFYGGTSDDEVLGFARFTNPYRAADRVSQYLISEILYPGGEPNPAHEDRYQLFHDLLLFKLFNRIETWEYWKSCGLLRAWYRFDWELFLDAADYMEPPRFNAAYINPMWVAPPGYPDVAPAKSARALQTIHHVLATSLPDDLVDQPADKAFAMLYTTPNFGPFITYQILTDLGYSDAYDWGEDSFTRAGPQAREGVAQLRGLRAKAETVIREMRDNQEAEFSRLGIDWQGLFGRPLTLIDCQNLFCEFTKYIKLSDRVRGNLLYNRGATKKRYRVYTPSWRGRVRLWFPNKWGINANIPAERRKYEVV